MRAIMVSFLLVISHLLNSENSPGCQNSYSDNHPPPYYVKGIFWVENDYIVATSTGILNVKRDNPCPEYLLEGEILDANYFNNSLTVALAGENDNNLLIYSVTNHSLLWSVITDLSDITQAWISPDGSLLAIRGPVEQKKDNEDIKRIEIWDLVQKIKLFEFDSNQYIVDLEFSKNNHWIAAVENNSWTWIWDMISGEKKVYKQDYPDWYSISDVAFNADNEHIILAQDAERIISRDVDTGESEKMIFMPVLWFSYSEDDRLLATLAGDTISILDLETFKKLTSFKSEINGTLFSFSPDGEELGVVDIYARSMEVFSLPSGQLINRVNLIHYAEDALK